MVQVGGLKFLQDVCPVQYHKAMRNAPSHALFLQGEMKARLV